jgi:hypothetical protein
MKKPAAALGLVGLLAMAPTASASPYNRDCGSPRDGWVVGQVDPSTNNYLYVVNGPWHINMTAGEAIRITRRFPPGEFNTRISLSETPCIVGQAIALRASQAWASWPGNSGWVNVSADTYGGTTHIGRFYCNAHPSDAVASEACTMRYRGGRIIGSFKIYDNPYG